MNAGIYDKDLVKIRCRESESMLNAQTWYNDLYLCHFGLVVTWATVCGAIGAQIFQYGAKVEVKTIVDSAAKAGASLVLLTMGDYNSCSLLIDDENGESVVYLGTLGGEFKKKNIKLVRHYVIRGGYIDIVNTGL
ncbi:MAG: hypothetical protein COS41_03655 [Elusimicrobia bacterium CG03_land_8_20_14_0_80_50_18]|nr:MAG: hypothetical protein COS41_03655 [Elusimicrobia bacterium CG03_land_8_20_14_0_80_50_18]